MNGSNTASPVNNIFTSTDITGCLTVFFESDATVNEGGWIARVTTSAEPDDTTPPVVMANDTTLFLDENGMAQLSAEDYEYAASDENEVSITDIFRFEERDVFGGADAGANNAKAQDQVLSFFCDDVGNVNIRVEIVATDASGNETRDTITVTVLDTIPPTAVCLDITVQLDAAGDASIATGDETISQIDGGSTDNCDSEGLTFSESMTEFTCDNVGPNTVTLTASTPVSTSPQHFTPLKVRWWRSLY
jgi:hypothetical protein